MNTQSTLQSQFPLQTSTKFTKKILAILPVYLILGGVLGILVFVVSHINSDTLDVTVSQVIAYALISIGVPLALYAWYLKAYIRTYYYSADQNFVTIKKGVLAPSEIHVQYQKIQDVYVDQDVLDRILGLYDVHIASATAASGIEAHIDGVNKEAAEGLKNFLLSSIQTGGAQQQTEAVHTAPAAFVSETELSSKVYPLSSTWFAVTFISRLLWSLAIIAFYVLAFTAGEGEARGSLLLYGTIYGLIFLWSVISLVLWKSNYAFEFKEHFIYYKEGAISIKEKHMPYASIQDVSVSQNFLERIFGFAKVVILDATQTGMPVNRGFGARSGSMAAAGISLQGLSKQDADHIADIIKTTILNRKQSGANGL